MDYATRLRLFLDSIIQERTFVAYVAKHNGDHFEAARDFYKSELQGRIVQTPIGPVRITGAGWKKFKGGIKSDYMKAALVEHIEDVLKHGRYGEPVGLMKERRDFKTQFHFATKEVELGGNSVMVGLTVAEDPEGRLFYNINHANSMSWKRMGALDSAGQGSGIVNESGRSSPPSLAGSMDNLVPIFDGCNLYAEA